MSYSHWLLSLTKTHSKAHLTKAGCMRQNMPIALQKLYNQATKTNKYNITGMFANFDTHEACPTSNESLDAQHCDDFKFWSKCEEIILC